MKKILLISTLVLIALVSGTIAFRTSSVTTPETTAPATQIPEFAASSSPVTSADGEKQKVEEPTEKKIEEKKEPSETIEIEKGIDITLTVEGRPYEATIEENSTVYYLMVHVAETQEFRFSGRNFGSGLGYFVEEINGKKNDNRGGMFWVFSINGKKSHLGISNYILKPNDIISWTYESQE